MCGGDDEYSETTTTTMMLGYKLKMFILVVLLHKTVIIYKLKLDIIGTRGHCKIYWFENAFMGSYYYTLKLTVKYSWTALIRELLVVTCSITGYSGPDHGDRPVADCSCSAVTAKRQVMRMTPLILREPFL